MLKLFAGNPVFSVGQGMAVLAVSGAVLLGGCRQTATGRVANPQVDSSQDRPAHADPRQYDTPIFLGAFDVSTSESVERRNAYLGIFQTVAEEGVPPRTRFHLWAFAAPSIAIKLWDNPVRDAEDLREVGTKLRTLSAPKPGTYIGPFLRAALAHGRAVPRSQQPRCIAICTDGGWTDFAAARKSADELARDTRIKAVLVGPIPVGSPARNGVESAFGSFGEERLICFGPGEAEAAAGRFRAALRR
jgi:hypothetical protein